MVRSAFSRVSNHEAPEGAVKLKLPGLGEFNFDPELDLGQYGIEAGIAGGGFQIGRGITQPVHGRSIEVAGEQSELEIVEHVERAAAACHRALAAFGRILDALHRQQRIDAGAAFGGAAERVSSGAVVVSGSANPVELVRRVLLAGDPSVVPFGP